MIIGESGSATLTVPIPSGTSHLALTAFSLHPEQGMAILPEPVQWRGSPGFWLSVEAPGRVGVWEQVGVRVTAVNHHRFPINAIIVLANNPAYKFVKVDGFDAVDVSTRGEIGDGRGGGGGDREWEGDGVGVREME